MARGTIRLDAAWMRDAIAGGKMPSRPIWSLWMKRTFAPHEDDMAIPHRPIAAIDTEPEVREVETIPPNQP